MSIESLDINYWSRPRFGFFAGPIVIVVMLLIPPPDSLSQDAWGVAAVGLLMAIWWVSNTATAIVYLMAGYVFGIEF